MIQCYDGDGVQPAQHVRSVAFIVSNIGRHKDETFPGGERRIHWEAEFILDAYTGVERRLIETHEDELRSYSGTDTEVELVLASQHETARFRGWVLDVTGENDIYDNLFSLNIIMSTLAPR